MPSMEAWIEYASTYSYLTVARIGGLAAQPGMTLDWQPFFLPPVREHQGLGFPFPEASAKTAHMWRDLERRAATLGVPYRRPSHCIQMKTTASRSDRPALSSRPTLSTESTRCSRPRSA